MSKITNLIGTTWQINIDDLVGVPSAYGQFNIIGVLTFNDPDFGGDMVVNYTDIKVGYNVDGTNSAVDSENSVLFYGNINPVGQEPFFLNFGFKAGVVSNFVINVSFTDGTDISNPLFIDFINTYGTLVSGGVTRKFTKLIPENQCSGGTQPDRDFVYVGGEIQNSVNGNSEAFPSVRVYYRAIGSTGTPFHVLSPTTMGSYKYFVTVPKGYEIRFGFSPTATQADAFQYFRSEKLGFNITSVVSGQYNYTDWIELNEDVFDVEGYSHVTHNSGETN